MAQSSVPLVSALAFIEAVRADVHRVFRLSLVLAAVVHAVAVAVLMQIHTPTKDAIERATRPLAVKFFIRRDPRVTKPFELRKAPQAKRQLIERQAQLAQASMNQVQSTASFNTRGLVTQVVAAPSLAPTRALEAGALQLEPTLTTAALTSTRAPDNKVDMALEMLDVNSMDTGRYRAMVVQDPKRAQAIKGFVNLALVISARSVAAGTIGYTSTGISEVELLVKAVNEYTGLQARFLGQITYDDSRLMDVPIIVPFGVPNESELENLARYLMTGGFYVGGYSLEWRYVEEALAKYGNLVQGQDFWIERLGPEHPIFHSFFDIKGGAPSGSGPPGNGKEGMYTWQYTEGYFVRGRMVGVGFSLGTGWTNSRTSFLDTSRQFQMAINIIVYALTQEGSVTQRLMQMVD